MPAITPASHRFIIDVQMLSNAAITGPLKAIQDDVSAFDQSLGTRGALNYPLQQFLLQSTGMKWFRLWRRHERSLLRFSLLFILSCPPIPSRVISASLY